MEHNLAPYDIFYLVELRTMPYGTVVLQSPLDPPA